MPITSRSRSQKFRSRGSQLISRCPKRVRARGPKWGRAGLSSAEIKRKEQEAKATRIGAAAGCAGRQEVPLTPEVLYG